MPLKAIQRTIHTVHGIYIIVIIVIVSLCHFHFLVYINLNLNFFFFFFFKYILYIAQLSIIPIETRIIYIKKEKREIKEDDKEIVHGYIQRIVFVNLLDLDICIHFIYFICISYFALFYLLAKFCVFIHFACLNNTLNIVTFNVQCTMLQP